MIKTYTIFLTDAEESEIIESEISAQDVLNFLEGHDAERYRVNKYVIDEDDEYLDEELNGEDWLDKYTVVTQTRELI